MAKKNYALLLQDGKIVGVEKTRKYLSPNCLKRGRAVAWLKSMDDAIRVLANAAAGEFGPVTSREATSIEEVTQDVFLDAGEEGGVYVRDIVARLEDNRKALRDTQIKSGLPALNSPEDGKVLFGGIIPAENVKGLVTTKTQSYLGTEHGVAYVWADDLADALEALGVLAGFVSWINHADEMGVVNRPWGDRYGRFYSDIPELTAAHFMAGMSQVVRVEEKKRDRTRRLHIERGFDSINTPDEGQILYGAFVVIGGDEEWPDTEAVTVWADSGDDAEARLRKAGYTNIEDIEEVGDDGTFGM